MKILGIISEYNPFHNGHQWQIEKSKQETGAQGCIAIMSGNITQRGAFPLLNKWDRTILALKGGVDLVIELPFAYAGQSAEAFALGGIKILNATGVCTFLSFGSESGDIEGLKALAEILEKESPLFKKILKYYLKTGISFPKAREKTIHVLLGNKAAALLSSPNNILGIEYLKALRKIQSKITPFTIKRQGADYHSIEAQNYPSATGIRYHLFNHEKENLEQWLKNKLPYPSHELIKLMEKINLSGDKQLLNALRMSILGKDIRDLKRYPYVSEGLEHKIVDNLKTAPDLNTLIKNCISKRIPQTRIQRILINRMLDLDKQTLSLFSDPNFVPYIRVLGFNKIGQSILGEIKKYGEIPILTNLKSNLKQLSTIQNKLLDYDIRSTDLFNLFYEKDYLYHQDFLKSPVRL